MGREFLSKGGQSVATVLYITANPKNVEDSYSLTIGEAFLAAYREAKPDDKIVRLDLYQTDVPMLDRDVLEAWEQLRLGTSFNDLSLEKQRKTARIDELVDQFVAADKYVFVTPLWNLGFPAMMKAYIDVICAAGKTFKYTEEGSVGLLTDKKAVHIQARGGVYEGASADWELGDRFMRKVLQFLGIPSIRSVIAEGMAQMPDQAEEIKARAIAEAKKAAAEFAQDNGQA